MQTNCDNCHAPREKSAMQFVCEPVGLVMIQTKCLACENVNTVAYDADAIFARNARSSVEPKTAEKILSGHKNVYAGFLIPQFEFNRIDAQMFAGRNPLSAYDVHVLAAQGVTHVLDLRRPQEWEPPMEGSDALAHMQTLGVERKNICIPDMGVPTNEQMQDALAFIADIRARAENQIYVHCRAGW